MDSSAIRRRCKALLTVMLIGHSLCGPAVTLASAAEAVPLAQVSHIQGGATIQRADALGFVPLDEGVMVTLKDVVATDADETSKITEISRIFTQKKKSPEPLQQHVEKPYTTPSGGGPGHPMPGSASEPRRVNVEEGQ